VIRLTLQLEERKARAELSNRQDGVYAADGKQGIAMGVGLGGSAHKHDLVTGGFEFVVAGCDQNRSSRSARSAAANSARRRSKSCAAKGR
jgi:hypothetical protein